MGAKQKIFATKQSHLRGPSTYDVYEIVKISNPLLVSKMLNRRNLLSMVRFGPPPVQTSYVNRSLGRFCRSSIILAGRYI